jgi:hypothetical protein
MNESFVSSFLALCETSEMLSVSTSELGLLVFYICYLLMLLRKRKPTEIAIQVGGLLRDVEESVVDVAVKDRIIAELQGLMYLLQHGKAHQYQERIERLLADWRGYIVSSGANPKSLVAVEEALIR